MSVPQSVPANHLRGQWCYLSQVESSDLSGWVLLNKPHWIGPWHQHESPAPDAVNAALATIERAEIPLLFAKLKQDSVTGLWQETNRLFVVPDSWPG